MSSPSVPSLPLQSVLKHLGVMGAVAAVLGVVVAGLAIPFAGVAGIAAKDGANTVHHLPKAFNVAALSQTTKIVDRDGKVITQIYDQNRVYRPLSQIAPTMRKAILSIEDYRFYQHGAMDMKGTLRALVTNQADNGAVQGGSSITQQLVKQTLLYEAKTEAERKAATEKSTARKIRELRYAIALEENHSKDWILEHYLNAAYFGDGAYGVQAAAKHYFGVNASQLNWVQAATIAGLVKNPTGYDPTDHPDAAIARRNVVINRMAQLKVIPEATAAQYTKQGLGLHVTKQRNGCLGSSAEFFCDYVLKWLEQDPALGRTVTDRDNLIRTGGLTIKTTLDSRFQDAAQDAVSHHVSPTDSAIGAIAELKPGTGEVRALAQSRPMGDSRRKGESYLNYLIPAELGHSQGFQAGSTFKLFVDTAAIEKHFPMHQMISSPPEKVIGSHSIPGCNGEAFPYGTWDVHNSTSSGMMDMYSGTRESVNTYFAQLEQFTGVCTPYKYAKKMGVNLTNPTNEIQAPFTLGVASVSPLEMAEAYATVAARGKHCDARPVTAILDSSGKVVKTYNAQCQQVMQAKTADAVNDVLRGVMEPGGFGQNLALNVPSAGKTGTTNSNMAVWFDGYTPQLATIAMVAGANYEGHPISLNGQYLAGGYIATAHGSTVAGPMWGDAMHPIEQYLKDINFHAPDPNVINGHTVDVPSIGGLSVDHAKAKLKAAGFRSVMGGYEVYSDSPSGAVAYGTPSGRAAPGSTITIYVSKGPAPAPPPKKKSPPKPKGGKKPPPKKPGGGKKPAGAPTFSFPTMPGG
ncbi:MAG: penicillin-binding protein [Nocardioides sp.]|nr:penicillin-binding protein [Nocardioides sp.]